MTPNSSTTSYCPVNEFLKRVDQRTVGDWASDTGNRIVPTSLPTDLNVIAALMSASGMLESACLKGERYQPTDINLLVNAAPPTAATAYVFEVITRLAEGLLWRRRPDLSPYPPLFDWAMNQLEQLEFGGKILAFVEVQDAGIPGRHVDILADVETRGLVVTQARRFIGRRGFELNG